MKLFVGAPGQSPYPRNSSIKSDMLFIIKILSSHDFEMIVIKILYKCY